MGIRDSEADENVSSSHVRDQNGPKRRNAKIVKAFCEDRFSPPEIAFFAGGWNKATPTLLPSWTAAFLFGAHFRTKDFT